MSGAAEPAQEHERTPSGRSEAASTPSRAKSGPRRWRSAAKWTAGALLTLDLGVLLVTLSLASATADGPSTRTLRHSLAILFEIDAYLDDHLEALQQDARDTEEGPIVPPDLPMRVPLSPEEVRSADREELRTLILDGAAARVHDEGVAVLHEGGAADIGVLSTQGALRNGMDFFRPTPHRVLTGLTIAFASTAGLLALGLMLTSRGYGRLVALGASVLVAAAPFLIAAVAVRFAFRVGADGADEYASHEFLELGQELTWALIRNGIIFTVGSAAVFATGIILARWSAGVRRA